jgi:ADP-ribose pyrophosphatase YjhB (NUDIX family)
MADTWKEAIARLARRRPFNGLLAWGVRLVVPRQRVGVALVAFNANEEVLLLRHVFHTASSWGLPGGWLNRDEAPADGLARELREETGLGVVLGPPVLVAHEDQPPHIVLAYLGWMRPGPLRLNGEILEARWFKLDRLPRPLWPFTERAIAAGLALSRTTPRPAAADQWSGSSAAVATREVRQPA